MRASASHAIKAEEDSLIYTSAKVDPAAGERLLLHVTSELEEQEVAQVNVSCSAFRRYNLSLGMKMNELTLERLKGLGEYEKAVLKGMQLLGYGANSRKRIEEKLTRWGFDPELARQASVYLEQENYIDEKGDAERLCESMLKKGYGPRRVLAALREKGYSDEAAAVARHILYHTDIAGNCALVFRKKIRKLPESRAETQKVLAKLTALGYNIPEIKEALRRVSQETR